ncbi:Glyoxalase/Bleomycin resistance protein/Dioxygenase superfamily protein [Geodermatophilus obscurus]|uniref:Glyoxalase/Bleomycin resistance protein/Dioxygenase superfamily protein n=1 Tax=Geodermatophilus obscurus TaxID=1861 RepID=A0A1M7UQ94_9ACTN|nr:ArsI/CadI family heavy metal resistance metalloenzyme [Geodermatophilus obscurus]SHN85057.1 Glyoxalase/Bleomycin resistance protein/Dioxygenase superfamily protein [Geodermatophilus obscurus]
MSRIQLALDVDDVEAATAFYAKLFGVAPAKTRPGYANSAIADPPLKLVPLENAGSGGTLNHLGVEVASVDEVDAEQTRLSSLGLASTEEPDSTCCYARQTKFWVENTPDDVRSEIYTVLADSPTFSGDAALAGARTGGDTTAGSACCTPTASAEDTEPAAGGSTPAADTGGR